MALQYEDDERLQQFKYPIKMNNSSSRERLRLAHEIVDKELQANYFGPSSTNDSARTKNVQSEISDLQKKLMDLERKMENIDVSSSNDDTDNVEIFKKRLDNAVSKEKIKVKDKIINHQISSAKKPKKVEVLSSDEDSEEDSDIYAKLQQNKKVTRPVLPDKKQPHRAITQQKNTTQHRNITQSTHQKGKQYKDVTSHPLKESTKSFKSSNSRKSNVSRKSNMSRGSDRSVKSIGSRGDDMKNMRDENFKDSKKISNLEKELNHYKRLCKKQQEKLEEYRVMEIEMRKLETNFTKSEQIRKQQKKIIEGLKGR